MVLYRIVSMTTWNSLTRGKLSCRQNQGQRVNRCNGTPVIIWLTALPRKIDASLSDESQRGMRKSTPG